MAAKRCPTEFERALERYEKTFGEVYPYVELKLTVKEAMEDITRRVRARIPVPQNPNDPSASNKKATRQTKRIKKQPVLEMR